MSEINITPGKWRIRPAVKNGHVQRTFIESENGTIICEFWTGRDGDARVLESAKDMYSILDDIAEGNLTGLSMYAAISKLLAKVRGEAEHGDDE